MIAGIDPSLTHTAIIVGDASHWSRYSFPSKPYRQGRYPKPDHVVNRMARIERLVWQITNCLKSEGAGPIYLEHYAFSRNEGRAQYAIEFGALLRWHLVDFREDAEVHEIYPTTLKKFATGKGNAPKAIVCASIAKRYCVEFASDDEYDAFALFRLGLCCEDIVKPATIAQAEAVNTVHGFKPKRRRGVDPNQRILSTQGA